MTRPRSFTDEELAQVHRYERNLHLAVGSGDYATAKQIVIDLQPLLRRIGNETRLQQNKALVFEAAMNADLIDTAVMGFTGVRKKSAERTKLHLQATALQAICHLRNRDVDKAEPLMAFVINHKKNIKSESVRRAFVENIVKRFEEESAFASLRDAGGDPITPEMIQRRAGELLAQFTEDELFEELGKATPPQTVAVLLRIDDVARRQLQHAEIRYLPDPRDLKNHRRVGKTVFSSIKRVLWKSLCHADSEVYKAWNNGGMKLVLNKFYIGTAIATVLASQGANLRHILIVTTALVLRFGIDVYCDRYKPDDIMLS